MTNPIGYSAHINTVSSPLTASPSTAFADKSSPEVLPPPTASTDFGGDPMFLIASLMMKNAQKAREQDSITAATEDKAQDAADARKVDEMQTKADDNFAAGLSSGISQCVQGAMSVASGVIGASELDKGGPNVGTRADTAMKVWDGAGTLAAGGGKLGETAFKKSADDADVKMTRADSESKQHQRAADALRKASDAAQQDMQKTIQILQDIKSAQAQGERAVLFKA